VKGESGLEWTIDSAHSQANFSVRHMAVSTVRGRFDNITGKVDVEGGKLASAEIDIPISSVNTNEGDRDKHLKSADFFDADNHPSMHFSMKGAQQVSGDEYKLSGDLTIRGVSQPVTLDATISEPFTDPWGNERIGVSVTGKLDRKAWNLTWNVLVEAGRFLVSDEVKIEVDAQIFHPKG
jgi:polyisoprenoid-binding protein YceI